MPASLIFKAFGWTGVPQWLLELIIIALAIFLFALWERHQGAQSFIRRDQKAVAIQTQANEAAYAKGVVTVFQEASTYDAAIHAPVDRPPIVRVCHTPDSHAVPAPPAAARSANGGSALRADPTPVAGPDIGTGLVRNDRKADAQVAGLLSYIRDVCKPSSAGTPAP